MTSYQTFPTIVLTDGQQRLVALVIEEYRHQIDDDSPLAGLQDPPDTRATVLSLCIAEALRGQSNGKYSIIVEPALTLLRGEGWYDERRSAGVIAVQQDLANDAIFGIGVTGAEALADARRGAGPDEIFGLVPATARLLNDVEENGGGPGDVRWTLVDGIVDHIGTDPADVTAYALADLTEDDR